MSIFSVDQLTSVSRGPTISRNGSGRVLTGLFPPAFLSSFVRCDASGFYRVFTGFLPGFAASHDHASATLPNMADESR